MRPTVTSTLLTNCPDIDKRNIQNTGDLIESYVYLTKQYALCSKNNNDIVKELTTENK